MKVTGGATLHAPIGAVWAALNDPAVLAAAIPGCERLTATAPDTYELTVTAGAGAPGTVSTSVQLSLADDGSGTTQLSYDADATVGGMIAGVGQRMLAGVAKRQASQFFAALDELLLAQAAPAAAVAGEAPAVGVEGAVPPGAGRGLAPGEEAGSRAGTVAAGPPPGRRFAGAAGVSFPTDAATRGASGMTWEGPAARRQPAGPRAVGPSSASFLQGAVVGAAIALAGVVVGGLISRRKH